MASPSLPIIQLCVSSTVPQCPPQFVKPVGHEWGWRRVPVFTSYCPPPRAEVSTPASAAYLVLAALLSPDHGPLSTTSAALFQGLAPALMGQGQAPSAKRAAQDLAARRLAAIGFVQGAIRWGGAHCHVESNQVGGRTLPCRDQSGGRARCNARGNQEGGARTEKAYPTEGASHAPSCSCPLAAGLTQLTACPPLAHCCGSCACAHPTGRSSGSQPRPRPLTWRPPSAPAACSTKPCSCTDSRAPQRWGRGGGGTAESCELLCPPTHILQRPSFRV